MICNFYYLAAYTAAIRAGYCMGDSIAIARAARFLEECPLTAPPSPDSSLRQQLNGLMFHHPPGEWDETKDTVKPAFFANPDQSTALAWVLICGPGASLSKKVVDHALTGMMDQTLSQEERLQRIGIAAHILIDAYIHQGFVGIDSPVINSVSNVSVSAPLMPQQAQELLTRALSEPLETVFALSSVTPDPTAGTVGCGQLEDLVSCPASIFSYSYLSEWPQQPLVSCANPLRYAQALLCLQRALRYIRDSSLDWTLPDLKANEDALLKTAVFFAGVTDASCLEASWPLFFTGLPSPTPYVSAAAGEDRIYRDRFAAQALRLLDRLWADQTMHWTYDCLLQVASQTDAAPLSPTGNGADTAAHSPL